MESEHHHLRAPGRHSEVGSAEDHHARASREATATGSSSELARRLNQIKRSSAADESGRLTLSSKSTNVLLQ